MTAFTQALVHGALTECEYCWREGPTARLLEHYRRDHPEVALDGPREHQPDYHVAIPGRFQHRLEKIREQTGRPVGRIIAAALDAQGLGRQRRPTCAITS